MIELILKDLKAAKFEVVIVGDFNTDMSRTTLRTAALHNFLSKNNLKLFDLTRDQKIRYTFNKLNTKSWIDHVVSASDNKNIKNVEIQSCDTNKSDHNGITLEYTMEISDKHRKTNKANRPLKATINWNNLEERLNFQKRVKDGMIKQESLFEALEKEKSTEKDKLLCTSFLNEISSVLINSTIRTKNESNEKKKRKRRFGDPKFKSWLDKDVQIIHNKMTEYYIKYKESGFSTKEKADYNNAKREFRVKKRLNTKLKRDRSLRNLNGLFRVDKISFWKKIKSMSNKKQIIDIDINEIRDDYYKQFNERIS
ncbi:unnamed protein product [Brachionus calyciflorus]|uniref:Endonuclease/exonuclease/phosphatase domain-containing protein n=1 Tax=Brachionus calyciflorus TaxID=104777 RepID=A0A813VRM7_9BILA|nr:unnamed protein product [Brachionus calyciflorus]